jgi:hypothetical protein
MSVLHIGSILFHEWIDLQRLELLMQYNTFVKKLSTKGLKYKYILTFDK